eukprot:55859-Pleurochrysis_carterae.AAC.1
MTFTCICKADTGITMHVMAAVQAHTQQHLSYIVRCQSSLQLRKKRFWRYFHDKHFSSPNLSGHHVCVTYKTKLTDEVTDKLPEFKPFVDSPSGAERKLMDPLGIEFMLQVPEVPDDPGVALSASRSLASCGVKGTLLSAALEKALQRPCFSLHSIALQRAPSAVLNYI